jgi:hypothetical protein
MHAKHADSAQDHLRVQRASAPIGVKNFFLPDIGGDSPPAMAVLT